MPYKPDQILISKTPEDLFQDVARNICHYAKDSVKQNGRFNMALAGGSTPKQLYITLSSPPYLNEIPWQHCHFYFGDERMVPHDHQDSNYLMAKSALFDRAPIPEDNIHPIPTNCTDNNACAAQYAHDISELDHFDLVLLGMGDDGHTASLFPQTAILQEHEKSTAAVFVEKMNSWRISLTYPTLNKARRVLVLIKGEDKQDMVKNVLYGQDTSNYPVTGVQPSGELIWQLDRAAHPDIIKT